MKYTQILLILSLLPTMLVSQNISEPISTEEKIYGLSKIWSEVNNNFVFLDKLNFDFDSLYMAMIPKVIEAKDKFEYIGILTKFMNQLNDGHTGIRNNQEYWNSGDYPPVFLDLVDEKFLVKSIAKDHAEHIPIGSELISADQIPYAEFKKVSPSGNLFSYVNSTVLLEFKVPNGDTVERAFIRNYNHKFRTGQPIDMIKKENNESKQPWQEYSYSHHNGFSLVAINTFQSDTVVKQFQADLSRINSTKGLIIDVRENGGGNSEHSKGIAQHIVERAYMVGPMWKTRINNSAKKAWGSMALYGIDNEWTRSNSIYWKGEAWEIHQPDTTMIDSSIEKVNVPVVILTGENTFSAAEDFLIYTMGNSNITTIGQPSAGSSGQPLVIDLPGGIKARICSKRDALPNGDDYIGIGIQPHILIDPDLDHIGYAISHINGE